MDDVRPEEIHTIDEFRATARDLAAAARSGRLPAIGPRGWPAAVFEFAELIRDETSEPLRGWIEAACWEELRQLYGDNPERDFAHAPPPPYVFPLLRLSAEGHETFPTVPATHPNARRVPTMGPARSRCCAAARRARESAEAMSRLDEFRGDRDLGGATAAATPSAVPARLHTPPEIAFDQRILDRFTRALGVCGVVGEDRNAKVVYLSITSRLLDDPVSAALKGASASGKSKTVSQTLRFFPRSAFIEMTAMSERALIYMKEDFAHRTLVLFEAVALREGREKTEGNLTAYFVRSLLSEGRICYPVTVKDKAGNFVTKTIQKTGPTNLIVTTTATRVHDENETRMLSLPTNDSADQTRAVMLQLADGRAAEVDFAPWHALQTWLDTAEHRVSIPFAPHLAQNIPPVAVRLRRDFGAILNLIRTHAILHQVNRERDDAGRIVASEIDYLAVRELVADLIADGVEATVSPTIRETVQCVRDLAPDDGVSVHRVAQRLRLDRSAASRRLTAARERGFIINQEERRGRPARYAIGEPMPEEQVLLPHTCTPPEDETAGQARVCSDAADAGGIEDGAPDTEPGWRALQREVGEERETDEARALQLVKDTLGATRGASSDQHGSA